MAHFIDWECDGAEKDFQDRRVGNEIKMNF